MYGQRPESVNSPIILKNAIKERVQESTLYGLACTDFFNHAAFYGGTALRLFHGLERFSEDLDFILMKGDPEFSFERYVPAISHALTSKGLEMEFHPYQKSTQSPISTAFITGNTRELGSVIAPESEVLDHIVPSDITRVKIEIDTNPPGYAGYERLRGSRPYPYFANLYDMPTLFASKVAAILCRKWNNRVKGRDFYDFLFYIDKGIPVNLKHLGDKLVNVGCIEPGSDISDEIIIRMLEERFGNVDFNLAKDDVFGMVKDPNEIRFWSKELFVDALHGLKFE